MVKQDRCVIEETAKKILDSGDVFALHGTSIENALSIMETGYDFHRTSFVSLNEKSIVVMCSYGWKENARGDAANVIIEVPASFYKQLIGLSEEEYESWKNNNLREVGTETALKSLAHMEINGPFMQAHIDREFIRGVFIFCDDKTYVDFLNNKEEALNHLCFIENEHFFDNLPSLEQREFVDATRMRIMDEEKTDSISDGGPTI